MSEAPSPDSSADTARVATLETEYQPLLVFGWAVLVGLVAGLVGALFRLLVLDARQERLALFAWLGSRDVASLLASVALPALGLSAALFLVRRFAPEASGSGVQEIEGALDGVRELRWRRVIPAKFAGGLLALGGGLVLGREGPTIQIGGNVGQMIGESFRLPTAVQRTLVAAGAGAGLAAAFNAPLAGVLFVLEEMRPQFKYTFTSVQAVVIACAVADVAARGLSHRSGCSRSSGRCSACLASCSAGCSCGRSTSSPISRDGCEGPRGSSSGGRSGSSPGSSRTPWEAATS
jgi:CIC family chloride channel protein